MSLDKDKKREGLKRVYLNNISEAFRATKDTGVYVSCVFDVDLKNEKVSHYLASTDGKEIIIIQKDEFPYDNKFKREFLETSLAYYATEGLITVLKSHDHTLDPTPDKSATLKSVSSSNNIIQIKNAEIEYVSKLSDTLNKIKTTGNTKLLFTNQKAAGIIDALVLAFLVGFFDGGLLMILLKYVIK